MSDKTITAEELDKGADCVRHFEDEEFGWQWAKTAGIFNSAANTIRQLEAELKILRRLAKKAEWGGSFIWPECPVCLAGGDSPNPLHYPDCPYIRLAELRRQTTPPKE